MFLLHIYRTDLGVEFSSVVPQGAYLMTKMSFYTIPQRLFLQKETEIQARKEFLLASTTNGRVTFQPSTVVINVCANIHSIGKLYSTK